MVRQVGRRFFITLGMGRYAHLPADEQLLHVPRDVRAMRELMTGCGYEEVLPGLGEYDGAEQVRQKLRHWSADAELARDDVVVVYFAGHGLVQDRDRHYLLCWDSQDADVATTALATEDLVRILCRGELRHLLLVLDTCAAGAGSADAAGIALQSIAYRHGGAGTSTGLWLERELLLAWWEAAAREESEVTGPDRAVRLRTPDLVQRALSPHGRPAGRSRTD